MGFLSSAWNAVTAPIKAPIAAVVNIAKGENVLNSVSGAALSTVNSSNALANAATGGALSKAPVVGSIFESSSLQVNDPFNPSNIKYSLENWAKTGALAKGYVSISDQIASGNFSGAFQSGASFLPKGNNQGAAPNGVASSNNFNSPAQSYNESLDLTGIAFLAGIGFLLYYLIKKG